MNIDRDLYEEVILEHNRNPHHYMEIPPDANHVVYGFNPLCGDEFWLHLKIEENVIQKAAFEGVGCALSVASTSMMVQNLEGLTVEAANELFRTMDRFLHGGEIADHVLADLGKLEIMGGVCEHPERIKCAILAWHILHAGLIGDQQTVCTE
ncbi:MAG: SUF system NifU family Fe-S cluster assembly protein [Magnetococcales bacterium]|nr:SUF system NifU family Fe-S cluster assembly protein [Magnetococcales bacterium]MBF0438547.1 SUF system NifU family Fe-S cluster assembly protein [Magnetococcales bacterium]